MQEETPSLLVPENNKENSKQHEPMLRPQLTKTISGFQTADWELALEQKKKFSNRYYKDEEISSFVKLQHFKVYGPGIYLFFKFVWDVSILFIILSILSIIPIVYNFIQGNALDNSGTGLQVIIIRTTIGAYEYDATIEESLQHKLLNVIPDIVSCFIFLGFYFYWVRKSNKIIKQIRKEVLFPSYYAVEINQFPKTTNPMAIQTFMNKFGNVKEVAAVQNYSEKISICKDIFDIQTEIKEISLQMSKDMSNIEKYEAKIEKKQKEIKELSDKLNLVEDSNASKYIQFYVSFESIEERDEVLKEFSQYQKCCQPCRQSPPENMLLNGQKVTVQECDVQPGGILWQNVHITWKTRWVRFLVQSLLLVVLLFGGFIFISYLNVVYVGESYDNINTESYTTTTILSQTNTTIVNSWCIKNTDFSNSQVSSKCQKYWTIYYVDIAITLAISISVAVFKVILKFIVIGIARFQRYTDHTETIKNVMKNLTITYILTTVLITFLMQANVFNISFKSLMSLITTDQDLLGNLDDLTEYSDLNGEWYMDIGYQIWFNWLVLGFEHFPMPIVHYMIECLNQFLGKREILHKKMVKRIQPEEFQIQDHYANVMMIIFIGFSFSGGMPCILIVSLFGLITRYVYFKYAFIRFSRVPPAYNEALNDEVIKLLPSTLIVHCLLSVYMYGATGIFLQETNFLSNYLSSYDDAFVSELATLLNRMANTWYMTAVALLIIIIIILKNFFVDFIISMVGQKPQKKEDESMEQISARSQRTLTKSYKLEKNPDYFEIVAIMKMMDKKKKQKRESITILPNEMIALEKEK